MVESNVDDEEFQEVLEICKFEKWAGDARNHFNGMNLIYLNTFRVVVDMRYELPECTERGYVINPQGKVFSVHRAWHTPFTLTPVLYQKLMFCQSKANQKIRVQPVNESFKIPISQNQCENDFELFYWEYDDLKNMMSEDA